jgi:hypothetical protein
MISELNPLALVRFSKEILDNGSISLPLLGNPDLREIFEQEQSYQLTVDEARSRTTSEERLFQIYDQELWEYAEKSPDPAFHDLVWYDDIRERLVFSQEPDERITDLLENQPILELVAEFLAKSEGNPEFSYLRSEVLANPNSLGARSLEIEQDWVDTSWVTLNWYDLLRESDHPSLFRFLDLMYIPGSGYEIRPHSWLALANRLSRVVSPSELTTKFQSATSDDVLVENIEIAMPEGELDEFVEQIMPFLVGANTEFLRKAFGSESLAIKQAVLCNPYSNAEIRSLAHAWNEELQNSNNLLHIPNEIDMAMFAAYIGHYSQIDKWISSSEEFDSLMQKCDVHVAKAISGLRLNQSE